jgi:hypothetical protein
MRGHAGRDVSATRGSFVGRSKRSVGIGRDAGQDPHGDRHLDAPA